MGSISLSGWSILRDIISFESFLPKPHFERIKKKFWKNVKRRREGGKNRLKGSLLLNVTWVQSNFFRPGTHLLEPIFNMGFVTKMEWVRIKWHSTTGGGGITVSMVALWPRCRGFNFTCFFTRTIHSRILTYWITRRRKYGHVYGVIGR